jgi:hypothetical protein
MTSHRGHAKAGLPTPTRRLTRPLADWGASEVEVAPGLRWPPGHSRGPPHPFFYSSAQMQREVQ